MIVFKNPGEIDIRSISTFGVSVKEGADPIGFFGTGLKYAIAVLLRNGHQVTIMSGETIVQFGVEKSDVRGQSFDFVTMKVGDAPAAPIGFTTELGKQWELWMAYREIACNCKDEEGAASYEPYMVDPVRRHTQIIVQGDEFEGIFANSHCYLLDDEPMFTCGTLEVRNRPSANFFYRSVRVADLSRSSIYTYNEQSKMELTEDRTVKNSWTIGHRIAVGILKATDKRFLRQVIMADEQYMESHLDFHGYGVTPSQEFLDVVAEGVTDRRKVNATALKIWREHTRVPVAYKEIALTAVQQMSMDKALKFCARIGFQIDGEYPIKVVESLGDGVLGLADDRTIYIAERVFHLGGSKQLASTLIEEFLHLRHGWADLTRELQSFLFEKLVSVGEELVGEPL